MNERIFELAKQAEKLADEHTKAFTDGTGEWKHSWNEVYDEKFAELIVGECYLWAKENGGLGCEEDFEALKEHFGVEE